ncbi:glycoside hydrolase family 15 protein [soil metagenome]
MSNTPIEHLGLLSDCRTAALVDREGTVQWMCLPYIDSPSVFGRLLDDDAGHVTLVPTGAHTTERAYRDATLVLETTFRTDTGTVVVTDALALGDGERGHDLGRNSSGILLRRAVVTDGTVEMRIELAPRPEYGSLRPLLVPVEGGLQTRGGATSIAVSCSTPLDVDGSVARGVVELSAGESVALAIAHADPWEGWSPTLSDAEVAEHLEDTTEAWRSWSALHQSYDGPWADLVAHSGRVLQGLTHRRTGAIVAAATTSLPEVVGGSRNWDYRYAWVRDASFTLDALWVAACPDEAVSFFEFLTTAAATALTSHGYLPIMFGVDGRRDLSERELPHLAGWRDSRPVRVGNGAWDQRQLDVYGELLATAHRLRDHLGEASLETKRFLADAADAAAVRWREPDQGIWEIRGEPRDFLYSKLMCWVALDRAIDLAPILGADDRTELWERERGAIRHAILTDGWSDDIGAFTQSFGDRELDASNLVVAMVGFLPGDDERVVATVDATVERLTDDRGLVRRYLGNDGLEGEEGSFLLCTFWLAHALALAGRTTEAREVFERAAAFGNDLDLFAEEVDPVSGAMIGNFPQAFSHIGLVNAAWAIHQAEQNDQQAPTRQPR